jgi:hypothetical protein
VMSTNPDHEGKRTVLAAGAFLLLPALCCGLPLLIAGGVLAGIGSVLGNPWVLGAVVALLVAVVVWRIRRHTGTSTPSGGDGCCPPEPAAQGQSQPSTESPTRCKEP